MESKLNMMYQEYIAGRIGKSMLEARIAQEMLCKWKEQSEDFLAWVYPRLGRAIGRYKECGSSFEHYVTAVWSRSRKEKFRRERRREKAEAAVWNARYSEGATSVAEPSEDYAGSSEPRGKVRNAKQVLALVLKTYHFLSDEMLERLAPACGVSYDELCAYIMELRELRARREGEVQKLREKQETQYYRLLTFQNDAAAEPDNEEAAQKVERAERHLSKLRAKLKHIHVTPSNREVALVLGVSKGTVDSALFTLKKKYEHILRGGTEGKGTV